MNLSIYLNRIYTRISYYYSCIASYMNNANSTRSDSNINRQNNLLVSIRLFNIVFNLISIFQTESIMILFNTKNQKLI